MSDSDNIKLWCWVLGDTHNRVFEVSIKRSATIHGLKKAIQEQKPSFKDIPADSLELFKFQLPLEDFNEDYAQSINLKDGQELKSFNDVSFYWMKEPGEVLSVVLPRPAGTTISPSSSLTSNPSDHASSTGPPAASLKLARSPSAQGGDEAKKMRPTVDTDSVLVKLGKLYTYLWGENRIVYRAETACSTLDLVLFDPLNLNIRPDDILLVRNEYLLAYDHIASGALRNPTAERLRSATLVTGQPGTGKTLFLFYVLARRLHERKPVAFQISPDEFALFGQDGVSLHPARRGPGDVPEDTWALSDSDPPGVQTGLCMAFLQPAFHVIQTSSPSSSRWKNWVKRLGADKYIMDVWSLEELRTLLALNNLNFLEGKDLFEKYGPSPRIIIYILTGRIKKDRYDIEVKTAAAKLAGEFSVVFPQLDNLDFSADISSKIFTVRPKPSMSRGVHALEIPTQFLCRTFGLAMSRQTVAQQHSFFRILNGHPTFHTAGGWLFEDYAHNRLSKSKHYPFKAYCLDGTVHHIPVPSKMIAGSTALKRIQAPHNFYWRPVKSNFKGVDAIIRSGDDVWALQYTISREHKPATDGLIEIRDGMNHIRNVKWHLVMVGSDLTDAMEARDGHKLGDSWKWPTDVYASELPLGQFDVQHAQRLEIIVDGANDTDSVPDQRADPDDPMGGSL